MKDNNYQKPMNQFSNFKTSDNFSSSSMNDHNAGKGHHHPPYHHHHHHHRHSYQTSPKYYYSNNNQRDNGGSFRDHSNVSSPQMKDDMHHNNPTQRPSSDYGNRSSDPHRNQSHLLEHQTSSNSTSRRQTSQAPIGQSNQRNDWGNNLSSSQGINHYGDIQGGNQSKPYKNYNTDNNEEQKVYNFQLARLQNMIQEQQQELWRIKYSDQIPIAVSDAISRQTLLEIATSLGDYYKPLSQSAFNLIQVSPMGKIEGSFASISTALMSAQNGDRIIVHPGHYNQSIAVKKDVCLLAIGRVQLTHRFRPPISIMIQGNGSCLIKGFCIRRQNVNPIEDQIIQHFSDVQDDFYAVNICSGDVVIQNCSLSSSKSSSIYARDSKLSLIKSRITSSFGSGITVYGKSAQLQMKGCTVCGSISAGVELKKIIKPSLIQGCTVTNCDKSGIFGLSCENVSIINNYIGYNGFAAVQFSRSKSCLVKKNQIYFCSKSGIYIHENSSIEIEANDINSNRNANILLKQGSFAKIAWNIIGYSYVSGVSIESSCSVNLHHNVIKYHQNHGVECGYGANLEAQYNIIEKNRNFGLFVAATGKLQGYICCNRIVSNNKAPYNHQITRYSESISKGIDGNQFRSQICSLKDSREFFLAQNILNEGSYGNSNSGHMISGQIFVENQLQEVQEKIYEKKGKVMQIDMSKQSVCGRGRSYKNSDQERKNSKQQLGRSRSRSRSRSKERIQMRGPYSQQLSQQKRERTSEESGRQSSLHYRQTSGTLAQVTGIQKNTIIRLGGDGSSGTSSNLQSDDRYNRRNRN